jgi:hypothetical protein
MSGNMDESITRPVDLSGAPRVRKCRGHFHVEVGVGEDAGDLALPGDPFPTMEAALAAIDNMSAARSHPADNASGAHEDVQHDFLREVGDAFCSLRCPSKWVTADHPEGQPHIDKCKAFRAFVANCESIQRLAETAVRGSHDAKAGEQQLSDATLDEVKDALTFLTAKRKSFLLQDVTKDFPHPTGECVDAVVLRVVGEAIERWRKAPAFEARATEDK